VKITCTKTVILFFIQLAVTALLLAPAQRATADPGDAVTIGAPPTVGSGASLLPGSVTSAGINVPFSQTFPGSGGIPPLTWSIPNGTLPTGIGIDSQTGEISGVTAVSGVFPFTIRVTDGLGASDSMTWTLLFNEGLRPGWPRELQHRPGAGTLIESHAPVIADLDGDGRDEVIVADTPNSAPEGPHPSALYVFYPDGSFAKADLPGIATTPAVADLDGDGRKEIIVSVRQYYSSANSIFAFHADLTPVAGFPAGAYDASNGGPGLVSSPVVADFDGGGALKIAVLASPDDPNDPNYQKNVAILVDGSGQTVPGWPKVFGRYTVGSGDAPPTVGDLDGDGSKELVFASADGYLRAFRGDGTQVSAWAFDADAQGAWNAALADLDADGYLDVVVQYGDSTDPYIIKALDRNGNVLPGWPRLLPGNDSGPAGPALADLDGDGRPEVVAIAGINWNEVHLLKGDGSYLAGWPKVLEGRSNAGCYPAVADIDGDGNQELLLTGIDGAGNGQLFGLRADGSTVAGFPKYASPANQLASSVAIGDVDGNGRPDLVVKSESGFLFEWELPQQGGARPYQWPMFRNDPQHSGALYPGWLKVAPFSMRFPDVKAGSTAATRTFTLTNPLPAPATISALSVSGASSAMFSVSPGSCGTLPVSLDAGQSCSIDISFSPDSAGFKAANLLVATTTRGAPPAEVALSGYGTPPDRRLSYLKSGPGNGTVSASTGTGYGASGSEMVPDGSVVTLVALPDGDSRFYGWTGCDTTSGLYCTVTLLSDRSVTGTFISSNSTLSYTKSGNGNGTVSSSTGTVYSASGSESVRGGELVTLAPSPSADSVFSGWSGCDSVTGAVCTVTMTAPKSATASFTLKSFAVTASTVAGTGTITANSATVDYGGSADFTITPAADEYLVAVFDNGAPVSVVPVGDNGFSYAVGNITGNHAVTVRFALPTTVTAVAAGYLHSLALMSDGTVWAWGANSDGQLGDGTGTAHAFPAPVPGLADVTAIAAGASFSLALKEDGTVWAWGGNPYGQLGDNSTTSRSTPVQVAVLSGVTGIDAGRYHAVALKSDGTVWAWGYNANGQLGDRSVTNKKVPVQVLSGATAVAASYYNSTAVKGDGTAWAWGANSRGQLGDGSLAGRSWPVQVPGLSNVVALAPSMYHAAALKSDGTVWSWGDNRYGQLGDGTTTSHLTPVQLAGLSGVGSLKGGDIFSAALKDDGTVWSWGDNSAGELGDGSNLQSATPLGVAELSGVVSLAAGRYHLLALRSDNTVWGWGANASGQLGDGTGSNRSTRTLVRGIGSPIWPLATVSSVASPSNATDAGIAVGGSGLLSYKYRLDGGDFSVEIPVETPISLSSLGEGTHVVAVTGRDGTGQWQSVATTTGWVVDTTGPTATVSGTPPSQTNVTSATLVIGGAEVVAVKYAIDGGALSSELPVPVPVYLNALGEGPHSLSAIGKDSAGNWQSVPTLASWSIELAAPTTTPSPADGTFVVSGSVTLACDDGAGSGCAATNYCLGTGCTPGTLYAGAITVDASSDLRYCSTDAAGNREAVKSAWYTVLAADYAVNLTMAGAGTGSVTSTPLGLSTGAAASARFAGGSTVTLHADPGDFSLFSGWSGACSGSGDCLLEMTAERAATATFSIDTAHATYIATGTGTYSPTIQAAYDASSDSDVIRLWGIDFAADVVLSGEKKVTLSGGYDPSYAAPIGSTTLNGRLRVLGGTVSIERLVFR